MDMDEIESSQYTKEKKNFFVWNFHVVQFEILNY